MTSKTSSHNPFLHTYKHSLKRHWVAGFLMSLLFMFMYCGDILLDLYDYYKYIREGRLQLAQELKEHGCNAIRQFTDTFGDFFSIFIILFAVIIAVSLFSFVMNKNSTNVFFSLGISRQKLFTAKYLAGATLMIGAPLAAVLLSLILNISFYGSTVAIWKSATYIVLQLSNTMLFAYTLMIFVMTQLGSIFESFVYFGVAIFSPQFVLQTVSAFLATLVYGSPYIHIGSFGIKSVEILGKWKNLDCFFEPFYYSEYVLPLSVLANNYSFSEDQTGICFNYDPPQFKGQVIFLLIIVVLAVISGILFSKRKTEKAGFMGASNFLLGFSVITVGSYLASLFLYDYKPSDSLIGMLIKVILLGALIMTFGHLVVTTVFVRSVKGVKKRLPQLALEIGIFIVVTLVGFVGLNAKMAKIPVAADVKSVAVSVLPYGTYDLSGDFRFSDDDKLDVEKLLMARTRITYLVEGFERTEEIDEILEINKKLKRPKGAKPCQADVRIIYTLKNGKEISRKYSMATKENWLELTKLSSTKTFRDAFSKYMLGNDIRKYYSPGERPLISLVSPNFVKATAVKSLSNYESGNLLLNAVITDIKEGNVSFKYGDKKPLGYISFYQYAQLSEDEKFDGNIDLVETNSIGLLNGEKFIILTEDMTHTLAFLSKNECMSYFEEETLPVRITYFENTSSDCGLFSSKLYNAKIEMNKPKMQEIQGMYPEYLPTEIYENYYDMYREEYFSVNKLASRNAMPDNSKVLTDETEIKAFMEKVRLISFSYFDGYFVQLEYSDGSFVYCYAVK